MPEWEWEHGKWGTKPKNLYINRHTNEFIHDGIYYDSNGNDIRLPMVEKGNEPIYETDKNGKTVCVNQLRGERNKRRWVRQRTGFLVNPSELSWLNDEVDRHIKSSITYTTFLLYSDSSDDTKIARFIPNRHANPAV